MDYGYVDRWIDGDDVMMMVVAMMMMMDRWMNRF